MISGIETVSSSQLVGQSQGVPAMSDVNLFNAHLSGSGGAQGGMMGNLADAVSSSEKAIGSRMKVLQEKMEPTTLQENAAQLLKLSFESSMTAITIQMWGKGSSKGTESIETLIKQQ